MSGWGMLEAITVSISQVSVTLHNIFVTASSWIFKKQFELLMVQLCLSRPRENFWEIVIEGI